MLVLSSFNNIQSGNTAQILSDELIDRVVKYYEVFSNIIVFCNYNYSSCSYDGFVYTLKDQDYLWHTVDNTCLDDCLSKIESWGDINNCLVCFETTGL